LSLISCNVFITFSRRKSEVIVDLTRSVVQQVLEKQGLLPSTLPDLATEAGIAQLKGTVII